MKKVLCVGNACVDINVQPVDKEPELGTLMTVDSISASVGGCAANTGRDLARLGVDTVVCCAAGRDVFGNYISEEFKKAGLGTDNIRWFDSATSTSIVNITSAGERSFLNQPGASSLYSPSDIPDEPIDECDILFLTAALIMDGFDGEPAAGFLKKAQEKGKITVMDTCWDSQGIWMPKIEAQLAYLDYFIPSIDEAVKLAGTEDPNEICDVFLKKGVKNVVIKCGSKGAYVCESSGKRYMSSAFRREKIVDTNGAGDSFCAGFLCGLSQDLDISTCVRFANAVGSFCVLGAGPCSGIPDQEAVLQFLASGPV